MKLLLLSPNQINRYNWGHQLFRNEINKHIKVINYGSGFPNYDPKKTPMDIFQDFPDVDWVLTYCYRYTMNEFGHFNVPKHMKRAHILVDYFPAHESGYQGSWEIYKEFLNISRFDVLFVRQQIQLDYLQQINCKIPSYWLPFSVDIKKYQKQNLEKQYDIITSSTDRVDVYPNRKKINKLIKQMGLSVVTKRIQHEKYIKTINQSKIAIISTNIFNSPNMKFTEFTSCGTFVLADKPADFEDLGFIDGKHLVLYQNLKDLKEKILYYLEHEKEREEIAHNGMNFTQENHNNCVRVKQMIKNMEKH